MDDLITWLRAQLEALEFSDWHERTCRIHKRIASSSPILAGQPLSCLCPVPEWLLADVAAKRRMVELHSPANPEDVPREGYPGWPDKAWFYCETCGSGEPNEYPTTWPCETIKLVAASFSDRPGYREEWKP